MKLPRIVEKWLWRRRIRKRNCIDCVNHPCDEILKWPELCHKRKIKKRCVDCVWWRKQYFLANTVRRMCVCCGHPNCGSFMNGWVCTDDNRKYYERKFWKFWRPK